MFILAIFFTAITRPFTITEVFEAGVYPPHICALLLGFFYGHNPQLSRNAVCGSYKLKKGLPYMVFLWLESINKSRIKNKCL